MTRTKTSGTNVPSGYYTAVAGSHRLLKTEFEHHPVHGGTGDGNSPLLVEAALSQPYHNVGTARLMHDPGNPTVAVQLEEAERGIYAYYSAPSPHTHAAQMGFGATPAPLINVLSHTPLLVSPADSTADGYVQSPMVNPIPSPASASDGRSAYTYTKLCHVDSPNLGVSSLPVPPYLHGQAQTQLKLEPEVTTLWNLPLPYMPAPLGHIPVPIPWTHPPNTGTFDPTEGNGLSSICGPVAGFHHPLPPHLAVGKDVM